MTTNSSEERDVRQAALDYIEGWFDGNSERMARSLHPLLTKRTIRYDPDTGKKTINLITREMMIGYTEDGGGKDIPRDKVYYTIDIAEIDGDIAAVRVESFGYLDHLHMIKDDGQWQIVNVIYKRKPTA